jgi:hypothetical protein
MLLATVVVSSTQDQYHRASRGVQHAQQKDQPLEKPLLLTIMGPPSIRLRIRRQARRSPSQYQVHSARAASVASSILTLSSAPLPAVVCVLILRRRAAFKPAVTTFDQAVECGRAQGIMNHAQPDQQSNPSLRTMRGSQAPRCAVTPAFEPAVAIPPLRYHIYNLASRRRWWCCRVPSNGLYPVTSTLPAMVPVVAARGSSRGRARTHTRWLIGTPSIPAPSGRPYTTIL